MRNLCALLGLQYTYKEQCWWCGVVGSELPRWVRSRRSGTMCARRPSCMGRRQCRSTMTASVGVLCLPLLTYLPQPFTSSSRCVRSLVDRVWSAMDTFKGQGLDQVCTFIIRMTMETGWLVGLGTRDWVSAHIITVSAELPTQSARYKALQMQFCIICINATDHEVMTTTRLVLVPKSNVNGRAVSLANSEMIIAFVPKMVIEV